MFRGRSRRGRSITRVSRNFVTPLELRRHEQGFVPRGRFDPPRIVANPWNSIVLAGNVTVEAAETTNFTLASARTLLSSQIGLPATTDYEIRVSRVDIWSTLADSTINLNSSLALSPSGLTSAYSNYPWIEDRGTVARPAHMHYVWPVSQSTIVNSTADGTSLIIFYIDHGANAGWTVHLHILWRPVNGDPIPTYRRSIDPGDDIISLSE